MKYDLATLRTLLLGDAKAADYIGTTDVALWLLRHPDSLLFLALRERQQDPDLLWRRLSELRPQARLAPTAPPPLTVRLQDLFQQSQADGRTDEESLTLILVEQPGALSHALGLMGIANLEEAVRRVAVTAPIRLDTPILNRGRNLSALARRRTLPPCVGREREIRQVVATLLRLTKNTPVLVGEAGVGKTAVAEGLAQYLLRPEAPRLLKGCTLVEFPVSLFTAGHKYVGETEKFANAFLDELRKHPDIIVFLDEFHTLIGAGASADNKNDVAQILKPALARGEIKLIGATTEDEYRLLEKDAAFERRVNPVPVPEPTAGDAIAMLRSALPRFAAHHGVAIEDEALEACVVLSREYLMRRKLPDKAFDLLDSACAEVALAGGERVGRDAIARTLAQLTGIDVADVSIPQAEKIQHVEQALRREVIGQDAAIDSLMAALKRAYGGIEVRDKPLGVFLFLGDPGTGKTQLARSLARHLFGSERSFIRFDMGEFQQDIAINRLIGSPPGYQGFEEGGRLTEFLKNHPYSVVLLDEIEKAHYRVADVFLSLFGEGRINDARGRVVDARHCICIMTSNQGSEELRGRHLLLGERDEEQNRRRLHASLDRTFRPELINRIDEYVVFRRLGVPELTRIAALHIERVRERLAELGAAFSVDGEIAESLAEEAAGQGTGARNLLRMVEEHISLALSELRLAGKIQPGVSLRARRQGGRIVIEAGEALCT